MYLEKDDAVEYLRISDHIGIAESESISNQRKLIRQYVNLKQDINLCGEFVDDGFTGANFDRPSFQRMMEQVRSGKIKCIIVKDLSRLGRNYIEVGKYIERVFPLLGVRFISVNENYDSKYADRNDSILIPVHNVMNDSYSKDTSIKIKSHLETKRNNGDFIGSFPPYGYIKSSSNKNKLIIDSYASCIVKDIFQWKLNGLSCYAIAEELNKREILSPLEYKKLCGSNYKTSFQKRKEALWSAVTVKNILQNEVYLGNLIQGKTTRISHRMKKCVQKSKDNWVRVERTHDAIVDKPDFEKVQWVLLHDTRTAPKEEAVYPFSGLLKCKDCGQNLIRRPISSNGKQYIYYYCSTHKKNKSCSSHRISDTLLTKIVLETVNKHIDCCFSLKDINIDEMELKQQIKSDTYILNLEKEIKRNKDLKLSLHENLVEGLIEKEDYTEFRLIYQERIHKAERLLEKRKIELQELEYKVKNKKWFDEFIKNGHINKLDRNTVVMLIKKIVIGEKQEVSIEFNMIDEFNTILSLVSKDGDLYVQN